MEERQDPADNGLMYSLHIAHTLLKKRKGEPVEIAFFIEQLSYFLAVYTLKYRTDMSHRR